MSVYTISKLEKRGNDSHVALVRTLNSEAKVLGLRLAQAGELGTNVRQVKPGDLLIQDLGQDKDAGLELVSLGELDVLLAKGLVLVLEQHDLGEDLVGEGAGHDEGGVTGGTAQVDETALGEEDETASAGHEVAVDLGLDVLDRLGVLLQPGNVNLVVEVTNI